MEVLMTTPIKVISCVLLFLSIAYNTALGQSLHQQRETDHNFVGTIIHRSRLPSPNVTKPQKPPKANLGLPVSLSEDLTTSEQERERANSTNSSLVRTVPQAAIRGAPLSPKESSSAEHLQSVEYRRHEQQPPRKLPSQTELGSSPGQVTDKEATFFSLTQAIVGNVPVPPQFSTPLFTTLPPSPRTKYWMEAEGLVWWLQDGPVPPLVTVDFTDGRNEGALTSPGARVLFGTNSIDAGEFLGVRGRFGTWLDHRQIVGIEASAFVLFENGRTFRFESDATGNPPLFFPIFGANLGQEAAVNLSNPNIPGTPIVTPPPPGFEGPGFTVVPVGPLIGAADITQNTELWGTELLARVKCIAKPHFKLHLLTGFRYLDLDEQLRIDYAGTTDVLNQTVAFRDLFDTKNQFYGAQIGWHMKLRHNRLQLDLLSKVSLGTTNQSVSINGNTTLSGDGFANPGTFIGGLYTQSTNIGVRNQNDFTIVPEVEAKLSFQVLPRLRLSVGYGFLYWNSVTRAGDQIDRAVNTNLLQGGALNGEPRPAAAFNRSGFWAHGLNFGALLRY